MAPSCSRPCMTKWDLIAAAVKEHPEKWFRGHQIDARDRALINIATVPFVQFGQNTYLRSMYHMKKGEEFETTKWVVENNQALMKKVATAGGKLIGYNFGAFEPVDWASTTVSVNIIGSPGSGVNWGMIGTASCNVRIFKGPPETCVDHPWDMMILRNCIPHTSSLYDYEPIARKNWDVLIVKCCEDMDSPWIVVSMRIASDFNQAIASCGCGKQPPHNNSADTGCITACHDTACRGH